MDSWVYNALDRLEAYGLIESALSGTKPYSRLEAARLTAEGFKKWEELPSQKKSSGFADKTLIPSLLERLKKEFKVELVELGILEGPRAHTYLKPVDEVILKYIFQTDNPVLRPQNGFPQTHTIYPIYNNDGIIYRKHHNFSVELQGEGRLWNHFSLFYRPILKVFENEGGEVQLEKGYLKVGGAKIELEVGRDSLWWGPGYHGALLMTNNARPFDMIKLSNSQPFLVPILGPFKFNLFFSRLDYGEPAVAKPLLYGLRLNIKPHPILEFGISHIAIFEGEGRKDLSLSDYVSILYSNRNLSGKLESNQQVAIDLVLRWPNFDKILPMARSLKFYGEYGAEDTGFLPDRRAFLLGLVLNDLFLLGRLNLQLEYAHTAPRDVPGAWYSHGLYPPIYHERIFGHHVGSNGEDIFIRFTADLSPKLLLGIDFNAETHGKRDAIQTNSYQWGADVDYLINDRMNLKGRYILEKFKDPNSIAGGDSTRHLFGMEFRLNF
ncbi:MAG: capsule assembly Wzi family protein [Thermodesulfobacteriota bacterium]|nr:capsule assembly Wzi family protein [Thermodesulfobacteriota bacterium]